MKFTKMHGCGNDYIYIDGARECIPQEKKAEVVRFLSDRHFGIGGDGVIFINPSHEADFEMEMYNADGSRGEMCGNGIRCVAKYVYDNHLTERQEVDIISAGQVKHVLLQTVNGRAVAARVNMGRPELTAEKIPVTADGERVIDEAILVDGKEYRMTCVSMGNPHAVVFVDEVEHLPIEKAGPCFERHERFPNRINTEFVRVIDREHVEMRVWERGSGETWACGTGATASAVAAMMLGLTEYRVEVGLIGGSLEIEWDRESGHVFMTGPAVEVFHGEIQLPMQR